MISFQEQGRLLHKEQCTADLYLFTIQAPDIARTATPGQFVMVRVGNGHDPLLRRPFSIYRVLGDGRIQIFFKVIGRGTQLLSRMEKDQHLDLLGPLGRGFAMRPRPPVCLVGGGVGVAPLLFFAHELLKTMHRDKVTVLLGARTKEELTAVTRDFEQMGLVAKIATDDGSLGHHGLVTELLQDLAEKDFLSVSACGPYPMMRAVAGQCAARGWRCQVSLETMMACGVAACLGCAVRKVGEPGYAHVCKDGPVFAAEEVLWR